MSAIVNVPIGGDNKKIYFIYNFKQVYDFMIIVMFNDLLKRWQQFIIHYVDGKWETDVLSECTNDETFKQMCRKLETIFDERSSFTVNDNIQVNETLQQETAFLLEIND